MWSFFTVFLLSIFFTLFFIYQDSSHSLSQGFFFAWSGNLVVVVPVIGSIVH